MKAKGWYSRGYLPHFDSPQVIQALTFRLHDSLPRKVLETWRKKLASLPEREARIQLHRQIAAYEDAAHGSCLLRKAKYAEIVEDAMLHFDGEHYRLLEWVIMPNHVHALLKVQEKPLPKIIKSWKSFSARQINLARETTGTLWARDYHDRYIRDLNHYQNVKAYIRQNPVKAKLCATPEDWLHSSAGTPKR